MEKGYILQKEKLRPSEVESSTWRPWAAHRMMMPVWPQSPMFSTLQHSAWLWASCTKGTQWGTLKYCLSIARRTSLNYPDFLKMTRIRVITLCAEESKFVKYSVLFSRIIPSSEPHSTSVLLLLECNSIWLLTCALCRMWVSWKRNPAPSAFWSTLTLAQGLLSGRNLPFQILLSKYNFELLSIIWGSGSWFTLYCAHCKSRNSNIQRPINPPSWMQNS